MNNALTGILIVLGIGLALLIFNHDTGQTFGIDNDSFGRMLYLLPIAGLLGAGILAGRRGPAGEVLRNIAIWLLIVLGLVTAYLYRDDARNVAARVTAGLLPGTAVVMTTSEGGNEVIIHKTRGSHFQTNVSVEGKTLPMLVDTGASTVVLSYDDARAIGLNPQTLNFTVSVMTANGRAMAAPIRLDEIAIGPIVRKNIRAMVAEDGRLGESLLGMSFLSTLGSLQMQTDEPEAAGLTSAEIPNGLAFALVAEMAWRGAYDALEGAAEGGFGIIAEAFGDHGDPLAVAQPLTGLMHAHPRHVARRRLADHTQESFGKTRPGRAHQPRQRGDRPVPIRLQMDGGEHAADLGIAHRGDPPCRVAAAVFDPGADQRCSQDVGQPGENAAGADPIHLHLTRHGVEKVRDGRLVPGEIAGQHRLGHHLQERMQLVDVEAHRGGERDRAAAGIGALHVEHALADFLAAEPVEWQGRQTGDACQHMRIAARKKSRIPRPQFQPLA